MADCLTKLCYISQYRRDDSTLSWVEVALILDRQTIPVHDQHAFHVLRLLSSTKYTQNSLIISVYELIERRIWLLWAIFLLKLTFARPCFALFLRE